MAIDWSTDKFCRLYKRVTEDDHMLSWEARALWHELLKRCDDCGVLETRRGLEGISKMFGIPTEVVERAMEELLKDGRVRVALGTPGYVIPNYVVANFSPRSAVARQRESRQRRASDALLGGSHSANLEVPGQNDDETESHAVTRSHGLSHDVTQISADQISASQSRDPSFGFSARRAGIRSDWAPTTEQHDLASNLGLNCDAEAAEFRAFWIADGRPKSDWNSVFTMRLHTQAKHKKSKPDLASPKTYRTRETADMPSNPLGDSE